MHLIFTGFVGICRFCLHKTDKAGAYNRGMEIVDKYIPREYLALKINYCRQRLEELPKSTMMECKIGGATRKIIKADNHRYCIDTPAGASALKLLQERKELSAQLQIYEAIWDINFKGEPLPECKPCKLNRCLYINPKQPVIMDKAFFDSLKNDDNKKYAKYKNYPYKGIYYRSASERDIAIYYTEMGIPFKYEPSVYISGLIKPINPDFALYIKELDSCKFHEHLGMKEFADYQRDAKVKYSNYIGAGLVPELDIIYTHDMEDVPFDIRYLSVKLNSAVYGSIICRDFQ